MRILNGWLIIEARDSICLKLNFKSIQTIQKHFIDSSGRSFLHHETECAFCHTHVPIRQRYVAQVIYKDMQFHWEYGDNVQKQIQSMASFSDADGFIHIQITRLGKHRNTFYRCICIEKNDEASILRYFSGKYGHLVRR